MANCSNRLSVFQYIVPHLKQNCITLSTLKKTIKATLKFHPRPSFRSYLVVRVVVR